MYRKKEDIANQMLREIVEYHVKYSIAIPLRILAAKYGRALKPHSMSEVIQELETKGLIYKDLTLSGANLIYPTKEGVAWLWL